MSRSLFGPIWRTSTRRGVRGTVILSSRLWRCLDDISSPYSVPLVVSSRNTVFTVRHLPATENAMLLQLLGALMQNLAPFLIALADFFVTFTAQYPLRMEAATVQNGKFL